MTGASSKAEFPPLDHSVYLGRKRLGRYVRVGLKLYAAYDADNRHLGNFTARRAAYQAVSDAGQPKKPLPARKGFPKPVPERSGFSSGRSIGVPPEGRRKSATPFQSRQRRIVVRGEA